MTELLFSLLHPSWMQPRHRFPVADTLRTDRLPSNFLFYATFVKIRKQRRILPVMDGAFIHSFNPFLIQFTESFGIRWYGLAYLGGFLSGYWMTGWLLKHPRMLLPRQLLSDFVFVVALGCIVGGRLGYCIFYRPDLLFELRAALPFWAPLAVHEGGMASHGGVLGMTLACIWFGRKHKLPFLHLGDLVIYGATLGIFFGRVANFINGELVGRLCQGSCIFPVKFPQDILSWPSYAPQKLSGLSPVVGGIGVSSEQWREWLTNWELKRIYETLEQVIFAIQHGNIQMKLAIGPLLDERHPSQLYAAFLEGGFLFLILFFIWRTPQKPGVIAALFLVLYPVGRFLSELFREPDLHIGFQALGLTRGQWLSFGMFFFGLLLLLWVVRSKGEKLGGWATK